MMIMKPKADGHGDRRQRQEHPMEIKVSGTRETEKFRGSRYTCERLSPQAQGECYLDNVSSQVPSPGE